MTSRTILLTTFASLAVLGSLSFATSASALSMQDCSAKYKAAQAANTLNGMKWNDFRKAQCGTDAAAAAPAATAPATAPAAPAKTTAAKTTDADEPDPAAVPAKEPAKPSMAAPAGVTFPTAISSKYASETPAKGRFHTCVDSYHVNKDKNTLGGLKWIQKGGGYYSLCNSKLKG
ncbi:hypothetical protein [Rhizobium sp. BK376]|uniref:hypothetical protein n=1 Tax=Rhizobium sp. BK376 TaxID=2512149 RepID=UPI00104785C6|nr:hypothetical protein [Rhizobium sp. BK376]TCR82187.1 hypothetical protein EV561_11191 [Rhizobium sp. BK376]